MLLGQFIVVTFFLFFIDLLQFAYLCRPLFYHWCNDVGLTNIFGKSSAAIYCKTEHQPLHENIQGVFLLEEYVNRSSSSVVQHDPGGNSSKLHLQKMDGARDTHRAVPSPAELAPVSSAAATSSLWARSVYSSLSSVATMVHRRGGRSTLARYLPGHTLSQVQSVPHPSVFGVRFHKCAQVTLDTDPPQLTFFLSVHNLGPAGGADLSQVAIRDSISGIVPLKTEGRVVEIGYQTFAIDSLPVGFEHVVNYTAHIRNHKTKLLYLPAFLTFSNASQNDVTMFGPLMANLTLRVNATDMMYPNHGVHFAGYIGGFCVTLVMMSLGFLAMNMMCTRNRINRLQQRRKRAVSDPEYTDWDMSDTCNDEAAFEDKMVDIMVLEDPQNMYQALENLQVSSLLQAATSLEASRVQVYKDLTASLLWTLAPHGQSSGHAPPQQRLLSVLHGQLLGMEGRLKEERGARMAALASQCNMETRVEMELEHHQGAAEKARVELLGRHADQQELLQCSVLLEKLHKLKQSHLQRSLLARHEEASARVQREIVEWRRVELHKIFCEELEEAIRMGELDQSTANRLQHQYFDWQDQLEEVLDVVLANQRYVLAERYAQRRFLVHSLLSLNSLISDTFSSSSSSLDRWLDHSSRGSAESAEQTAHLQDKSHKELLIVRQRLDEALGQEKRTMHCGLVKKRRELISDMLRGHKRRQKELSDLCRDQEDGVDVAQHLRCWQGLLSAQSLELAELIGSLDEEAAADIRKVTMRVLQSAMAEVKSIQHSVTQALPGLCPPGGAPRSPSSLHQVAEAERGGPGHGAPPGSGALQQAQERLHQEGKAAVRTLRGAREDLREAMQREMQEQKQLRAHGRAFFRCLCSSQLTLSDTERLKMKLEFQKCLSVLDRCLVLPHAIARAKLHAAQAAWRRDAEQQAEQQAEQRTHTEKKPRTKGRSSSEARRKTDLAELLLFQKKLTDRIHLFDEQKEMESAVMDKVVEEMQREREDALRSRTRGLAVQMSTLHYQIAERKAKVLETSSAMLTLHCLLTQQLQAGNRLKDQDMAQSIQRHCVSLEEADQELQKEMTSLRHPVSPEPGDKPARGPEDSDVEEERLFHMPPDCRMATVLQEALYKCEQVLELLNKRSQQATVKSQVVEDLKEQMELKKLYAHCDQDMDFAAGLARQCNVSTEVLLEALRLLLPTLPETELLSIVDALRPKQPPVSPAAEQDLPRVPGGSCRSLVDKLRQEMMHAGVSSYSEDKKRLQPKRRSLGEKLFPSGSLQASSGIVSVLVKENGNEDGLRKPAVTESKATCQHQGLASENAQGLMDKISSRSLSAPDEISSSSLAAPADPTLPSATLGLHGTGERVFVFRVSSETQDNIEAPQRKRKRNFLNLKKGSVAPINQP